MAATRNDKKTYIRLEVETGMTASGQATFSTRSFENINPELADDDALSIGNSLAGLQTYPLGSVKRSDICKIVEA